jgi:hypothetical protein
VSLGRRRISFNSLSSIVRPLLVIEFGLAIAAVSYFGLHDFRDVFVGSPAAVPVMIDAMCDSGTASTCHASVIELNRGRYRITSDRLAAKLTITMRPPADTASTRYLLVRFSKPQRLRLTVERNRADSLVPPVDLDSDAGRIVKQLQALIEPTNISFINVNEPSTRIVLDEFGIYDRDRGLLSDTRPLFKGIPPLRYHSELVQRIVARLCVFTVIAAFFVPPTLLRKTNPLVLGIVCFSICLLDLAVLNSPYSGSDLRSFYAGGPLQEPAGTNLNSGVWQGFRLLNGQGLTLLDGVVPWERMPGYGLFCALAGAVFGHRTVVDLAIAAVLLQSIFYSSAVALFAWAAGPLWTPAAVWAVGVVLALLPKELGFTQVDAIIGPIALLCLAALCVRLNSIENRRPVPLLVDVAAHASFALWFLMRPDVLVGWVVIALTLHWKHWQRLVVPFTMVLIIGTTWGAYKARYTHEFAFATSSAGASLFCGLWEVPSRFAFTCSDISYFDWIRANTPFHPQTEEANQFAIRQVLRFWLTYPGHFVEMVCHKAMRCLNGDLWPGHPTQLQVFFFEKVARWWLVQFLMLVATLSIVTGHRRRQTLLLGWAVLLDAPLFWIMFASEGRFYSGAGISLIAAAVPILLDDAFYVSARTRVWRTVTVIACATMFALFAWPLQDRLLRNDAFHYWAPLLDPAASTLSRQKQ